MTPITPADRRVRSAEIRDLLGAYRAILTGNASSDTPRVPAVLAGYLVAGGDRRPLGAVRRDLLRQVQACAELTDLERTIVVLYYGLELDCWPLTSQEGADCLANSLPRPRRTRGRPRSTPGPHLGDGVNDDKKAALRKLARTWAPLPGPAAAVTTEPDPLVSSWFEQACRTTGWLDRTVPPRGTAKHRNLVLAAILWARGHAGGTIRTEVARTLDQDIDWWAYDSGVFVDAQRGPDRGAPDDVDGRSPEQEDPDPTEWSVPAQPARPVHGVGPNRTARAIARISIALWEVLHDPGLRPGVARRAAAPEPSTAALTVATPDLQVVLEEDGVRAAFAAVEELEALILAGRPCAVDVALVLGWLRPRVVRDLGASWCGRAAIVTTKAAAENPRELGVVGLPWLETACAAGAPERLLAEASLNLSVTHSALRRYPEAEATLHRFVHVKSAPSDALSQIAIGRSAWRRRWVSSALEDVRGVSHVGLPRWALTSAQHGWEAVRHASDSGVAMADMLRAEVRVAEAVALRSAVHETNRSSSPTWRNRRGVIRHEAETILRHAQATFARGAEEGAVTAYDRARFDVISAAHEAVDQGTSLIQFNIVSRVREHEARLS